jgi:hypothetical protein
MATTKRKQSSNQADRTATKTVAGKRKETQKNPPPRSGRERSSTGDTKSGAVLALLNKPDGATIADMTGATGWQPHSVRGFLSGALKKKQGLAIKSEKGEDGQRRYRIAS